MTTTIESLALLSVTTAASTPPHCPKLYAHGGVWRSGVVGIPNPRGYSGHVASRVCRSARARCCGIVPGQEEEERIALSILSPYPASKHWTMRPPEMPFRSCTFASRELPPPSPSFCALLVGLYPQPTGVDNVAR
ncbi:hypothetical protein PV325_000555 [Microctonus aethiopoides]|nr:hypothetical protein PV325_000555 [Microctonus aethiopoides]